MILKHDLKKIYYEPSRSDPEAVKQLKSRAPLTVQEEAEVEKVLSQKESEEENILKSMKDERIKAYEKRRESVRKTERIYNQVLKQGKGMIKNVGSGNEEGLRAADAIIESVINILNGGAAETSLINHRNRMQPMVMVHEPEITREEAIIVDLAEDKDFKIQESLLPGKVSRETLKYLNIRNMSGYFMSESA